MFCEYCKSEFKTKSALTYHLKTAKKCLQLRGEFKGVTCDKCNNVFTHKHTLEVHKETCKPKPKMYTVIMNQEEYNEYIKNKKEVTNKVGNEVQDEVGNGVRDEV